MVATLKKIKQMVRPLFWNRKERRHSMVGPVYVWKQKRDFQIDFLKSMNLSPEHYLLDIGCGTLRGGLPIIDYLQEGHYFGVDIRESVLVEARKELKEADLQNKNPTLLLSSDFLALDIDQKFDILWACSVLNHMNDDTLNATLDFARRHMAEDGAFYANVNIGNIEEWKLGEANWQGFPTVERSLEFYRQVCSDRGLVASSLGPLKEHGHTFGREVQQNQTMLKIVKER